MGESGSRLFVGNLAWITTDESLRNAFDQPEGSVVEAKVIFDRHTGRSRGFGFVTFDNPGNAAGAKERMNGVEVDGREVRVDMASSTRNN